MICNCLFEAPAASAKYEVRNTCCVCVRLESTSRFSDCWATGIQPDMKAGSSPAIALAPSCRRYSGRLATVTIEHQAYTSCCSDGVGLHVKYGPCWPPQTPLGYRVACNNGVTKCSQCGGLALPLSPTSGIHPSTQPTGYSNRSATRHEHKTFPERLRDLSLELHEGFKNMRSNRALCEMVPLDLVGACNRQPDFDTSSTGKVGGPDLSARIGIVVFFRLLGSLQRNRNTAGILKLIKQVPSMIADTPVLSSWLGSPAQQQHSSEHRTDGAPSAFASLTTGASLGGVVDAIMSAAEELLLGNHKLSSKQRADVLGAMVGLAIKRGSLAHGLRVVKLLFCHAVADEMPPIPGVGHFLKVQPHIQAWIFL